MVWEASPRIVVANVGVPSGRVPVAAGDVGGHQSHHRFDLSVQSVPHGAANLFLVAGGDRVRPGLHFDNFGSGDGLLRHGF